jgi:predicted outer membrane repeat protein
MPSIRPPHPAILLAILIAGIGTGIPPATAADCNNNGIDDAVDIAGATSSDCNSDGRPDECGYAGVDLVAILDTSESVELESAAICAVLTPLADHLDSLGIDVTATILTINEPFSGFNCVDGTVLATLGGQVPGTGACGPITVDLVHNESWGAAVAIVAEEYDWRANVYRVIVPVSDEAACQGNDILPNVCGSADQLAVQNAITVANDNDAHVYPIRSFDAPACVDTLMADLADQTDGAAFPLGMADLSERLSVAVAREARAEDCDQDGVLDTCEIDSGSEADCNSNGRLDTCETGIRWYVDTTAANGNNDGSSWSDAFTELRSALFAADACVISEVWVAEGTYDPGSLVTSTFRMVNGVAIYGGFAGTETSLAERDIALHPTVLNGEISPVDEDAAHVVTAESGIDASAILDGFTITGGRATWDNATGFDGGGLWVKTGATPVIRNCTLTDNVANAFGGAVYLGGDAEIEGCAFVDNRANGGGAIKIINASPTITDCEFEDNQSPLGNGGAIDVNNGAPTISDCVFNTNGASLGGAIYVQSASPSIDRCSFIGNRASGSGGAILLSTATPTISNSFFGSNGAENVFDGSGGGIAVFSGSNPRIINSVFSDNFAVFGGGVDVFQATAEIVNCTFSRNRSNLAGGGGGLDNSDSQATSITNCVFRLNQDAVGLSQITQFQAVTPTDLRLSHSNVQGGQSAVDGNSCIGCGVIYARGSYAATNIDADPLFINPLGPDGHPGSIDDNLRLVDLSPCADAGSNGAVTGIELDADGFDRIAFGTVDMGAYEVFVDCNNNDLADVAELMDADTNGTVDLGDFQHFQLCFNDTGPACLTSFDRALPCDVVDLHDFFVLENQLTGPAGTMMMMGMGGGAMMMSPSVPEASLASAEPTIEVDNAALAFELRPIGESKAVRTLAPHTTYGQLFVDPDFPGLYRTDSATSQQYVAPGGADAPAKGKLCIIQTGDPGEFTVVLHMLHLDDGLPARTVAMEQAMSFKVRKQ